MSPKRKNAVSQIGTTSGTENVDVGLTERGKCVYYPVVEVPAEGCLPFSDYEAFSRPFIQCGMSGKSVSRRFPGDVVSVFDAVPFAFQDAADDGTDTARWI